MHNAPAAAPRSTHPSGTASRTSARTLALLQSPLFVDHQGMDTLRAAVASGNLSPDQEMSARRKIAGMEARMGKIAEKVGEIPGGRDLGELIDEKLGRGGHGTFSKGGLGEVRGAQGVPRAGGNAIR